MTKDEEDNDMSNEEKIAKLEAELERERMRLSACGVAAMAPEKCDGMSPEYDSASLRDVLRLHERCTKAEAELDESTRHRLLVERLGFDPNAPEAKVSA